MALEQSINLDSKSKGGIVGVRTRDDAVERWFLTSPERAAMTQALKEMCGLENCDRIGTHKEVRVTRVTRDEKDVQKVVATFHSGLLLSDPFHIPDDIPDDEVQLPLSNIASWRRSTRCRSKETSRRSRVRQKKYGDLYFV